MQHRVCPTPTMHPNGHLLCVGPPPLTFSEMPHMWETSKSDAAFLHCMVESMMLSLYWMGMDQPANGTILPGAGLGAYHRQCEGMFEGGQVKRVVPTSVRHVQVIQGRLLQVGVIREAPEEGAELRGACLGGH